MTPHKLEKWRTEFAWLMAAMFITAGTASIPVFHNPLFYFQDDFQSYFMPMFGEIARLLKSGEFPLLTDRIWYGGNILGEYQYAVFNPFSLGAYLVIVEIDQLHHAAMLFVLFHIAVLAGGLHMLARDLGADPLASLIAALIGGTSGWLIYWGASTWITALVGSAWFPWALWGLLKAYRDSRWVIPAALLTYLVLVSGWSFGVIALTAAITTILSVLFYKETRFYWCFRASLAFGSGLLMAAPALFPVLRFLEESLRSQWFGLSRWRPSLDGMLIGLGNPFAPDVWQIWDASYRVLPSQSLYYLSWFVPLVLFNAYMKRSEGYATIQKAIIWSITVLFALLSLSPSVWLFQQPFRFLPYFHFALALLVAMYVTEQRQLNGETAWRLWPTALAILSLFLIAFFDVPEQWAIQAGTLLSIGFMAIVVIWFQRQGRASWPALLAGSHVLLFFVLTIVTPSNNQIPDWRPPLMRAETGRQQANDARTFALYPPLEASAAHFGSSAKLPKDYWVSLAPGNTALYQRAQTVNGYTPILQRGYIDNFCFTHIGAVCSEGPSMILAIDPRSNMSYLDMMGVDQVVAMRGSYSDTFATRAGNDWAVIGQTELMDIYGRVAPQQRIGNIVQWPDGAHIENLNMTAQSESYDIKTGNSGGRVIIARAWYPGFRARLDGDAIPVEPVAGLVPSVTLPPGAQGELVIEYWPAGLTAGLYTAFAGILILVGFTIVRRFEPKSYAVTSHLNLD
ncbi:MAG: hypothetical protein ACI9GW_002723 [Halieaceae bacterium]|jgi:hypothetical protein